MVRKAMLVLSVLMLVASFSLPSLNAASAPDAPTLQTPEPQAMACSSWTYSGCCGSGRQEQKRTCDGQVQYRCVTGPC